tara:strand:+ start:219 stop:797 length:579 start_codon:yes stop_codon:yes gene_type:complete
MKKVIQLALLITIFISIYLFYFIYFKDNKELKVNKKEFDTVELNQDNNNSIQNLEYEVNIDEKNYYRLISKSSEVIYEDNVEFLKMEIVEGTFINDANIYITIKSNTAIYNIKNHRTNFKEDVKVEYLDNSISGENLILDFEEQKISIFDNIEYNGTKGKLFADKINIDLITKNVDILMDKPSKNVVVNVKK